jgi:hypothetical protein
MGEDVRSSYIVLGGVEDIGVAKRLIVGWRAVQHEEGVTAGAGVGEGIAHERFADTLAAMLGVSDDAADATHSQSRRADV